MIGSTNQKKSADIVSRLRLVFLAILAILLFAFVVVQAQLTVFNRSVRSLTNLSVPVFVAVAETERNMKELLFLLQRVSDVDDVETIVSLDKQISTLVESLRAQTAEFGPRQTSLDLTRNMQVAIDGIELGAEDIIAAKTDLLDLKQSSTAMLNTLQASEEVVLILLEDLSFENARTADSLFSRPNNRNTIDARQAEQSFYRLSELANTIRTITLEIEAAVDLAASAQSATNTSSLDQAGEALRYKFQGITTRIGALRNSEIRQKLAGKVLEMRAILFRPDGLLSTASEALILSSKIATLTSKQINQTQEISMLTNNLNATARGQIEFAQANLGQATRRVSIVTALATLISVIVIFWALIRVVERQINKRMAALTTAVLAIADGHVDCDVNVGGTDELGRMASALGVFRVNAKELKRSNYELEKFAFAAAHDMRSPLRAIQNLADWTIEDDENEFSQDGRENMALMRKRIGRLNQLLADLLEYSRVGKVGGNVKEISVKHVLDEVQELLNPDGRFTLTYSGPDHTIATYATPLRQILLNLIGNAIKHHDRETGMLHIAADIQDGRIQFSVQDDGAGIDPEYHGKIFDLFQTLRPRDEIEGSGLGLSIIRKLVEFYNGSISVHSDPEYERGTTFIFDLPEESEDRIVPPIAA